MTRLEERRERGWLIAVSPTIWAAHFMLCYATAAILCAKSSPADAAFPTIRTAIIVFTIAALAAIAAVGYAGLRRHRLGAAGLPHDDDSPEDRHRFIGFSTFLLSGLSGVAVVYAALTILFIGNCQ